MLWYLRRPSLYPHFVSEIRHRMVRPAGHAEDTREDSERWCAERAVSTPEALDRLGITSDRESLFSARFVNEIAEADKIVSACPVEMGGAGNLDLLYELAQFVAARKVIETGVAYGWSSLAILSSLAQREDSLLVSSDMPYPRRNNDDHVGCVVPDKLASHWKLLRAADRQSLPKAIRMLGSIDLCHYDSDKSVAGRSWAYPLLWQAVRPGGAFLSDDISDNLAFRDFALTTPVEPLIVRHEDKFVGVLMKPE